MRTPSLVDAHLPCQKYSPLQKFYWTELSKSKSRIVQQIQVHCPKIPESKIVQILKLSNKSRIESSNKSKLSNKSRIQNCPIVQKSQNHPKFSNNSPDLELSNSSITPSKGPVFAGHRCLNCPRYSLHV